MASEVERNQYPDDSFDDDEHEQEYRECDSALEWFRIKIRPSATANRAAIIDSQNDGPFLVRSTESARNMPPSTEPGNSAALLRSAAMASAAITKLGPYAKNAIVGNSPPERGND